MQELTGGGDLGYSQSCLSVIKRGAGSIEDVLSVVRAKCAGRKIRNNGYVKQVIEEQFGETVAMREDRDALEAERARELSISKKERQDALEPLALQAKRAASDGDREALRIVMAEIAAVERRFAA